MNSQSSRYITEYQSLDVELPGQNLSWLTQFRKDSLAQFSAQGFPSSSAEEWRYTNFSAIEKKLFIPSSSKDISGIDNAALADYRLEGCYSLVLLNGQFVAELSELSNLPGNVHLCSMASALQQFPDEVAEYFGKAVTNEDHGFIHFNTAWFTDGWFLKLPENTVLDKPIQILNVVSDNGVMATTRNLIIVEQNAQVEIVESYFGLDADTYLTEAINEVFIRQNARVNLIKLQNENDKAFHFGGAYIKQEHDAFFNHQSFSFGAQIARNEIHTDLGQGSECHLNGLYLGAKRQVVDNHTRINHREPNAISRETYKGILNQRARGVFQGRVVVYEDAQKTDSEMNNRNLLLSDDAEADAKPQLEIYADDVKCAHGVTVGQLDEASIFYLQSRNIDPETARNMLTFAFANEMVEKISLDDLHTQVLDLLLEQFPQMGIRKEWM
jgi:Fe-S cluster assembly protein SufD